MDSEAPRVTTESAEGAADTHNVARATRYTAVSQVVTQLVRFGTNIVLARLLTPEDFGIVAIALVVTTLLDQVKDLGTGSAIIQRESVDDKLLNSVFYLNLALGALLGLSMYLTAGPVASLLGTPEAAPVLQAFSIITVATSLAQIHHSLLRRNLRFFEIALVACVSAAATAVVSIVGALLGLNYWALVIGTAVGALVGTVLVWIYDRWRPSLMLSLASLKSIWGYSVHLFLANILFIFFTQVDKIIIGRFLGSSALGTYTLAQRTVTSPITAVSTVVNEVSFPAFSRRQNDHAALRSGIIRSSQVVALITFPAMIGLAVLASSAVPVVFGPQWYGLIPVIWLLAPTAAVQSMTVSSTQVLLAKGRSDWAFRWGVAYCIVLTVLELFGVRWGLVGVAAAYAAGILLLTPFELALAFRTIEMRLRDYFRELLPHVWITAVMAVCVAAAASGVRAATEADWAELLVGSVVGVVVYGLLILIVRPPALYDALIVIRGRRAS
jgi:O-antigen/teichoic acid export membrane protein